MMQAELICGECLLELVKKGIDNLTDEDYVLTPITEITDNGVYIVTCSKGHNISVVLQNHKFELLFELGLNAIIDGYYRDAVSSLTASLERFYEFYIKILWRKSGKDFSAIEECWKIISNSSERQFGAFIALFVSDNSEMPPFLNPNSDVAFRNNVIHKGHIPTKEKSIKYAKTIRELIEIPLDKIKEISFGFVKETYDYYSPIRLAREQSGKGDNLFACNIITTINVLHETEDLQKLDILQQLKRIQENRVQKKMILIGKNSKYNKNCR